MKLTCLLQMLLFTVYVVIYVCMCVRMSVAQCGSETISFNNASLDILRWGLLQNPEFTILAVLASHLLTRLKTGHKIHLVFTWVPRISTRAIMLPWQAPIGQLTIVWNSGSGRSGTSSDFCAFLHTHGIHPNTQTQAHTHVKRHFLKMAKYFQTSICWIGVRSTRR